MVKPAHTTPPDGRRVRGEDNRRRIVEALVAMIRGGVVAPTAEQIAEHAGVGLRTVFRHFEDMETLYREVDAVIEAQIVPMVLRPFAATRWHDKLHEMVARRAEVFETIMPFRAAGEVARHGSPFLQARHAMFAQAQREALRDVLPAALAADTPRFDALDLVLSFEAWRRLRREQGLSIEHARAALRTAVDALCAPAPVGTNNTAELP